MSTFDPVPAPAVSEPEPGGKDSLTITSLSRGLAILKCFSNHHEPLGTADIARMTGLPQPTVWRLCHTLKEMGYLAKNESDDKLRLAPPALSLGYVALTDVPVSDLVLPYMQSLASRFHGGVSFGTREDLNIVYLQRCQGTSIIFSSFRIGSRVAILLAASGWAYLAGLPANERAILLDEIKQSDPATFAKMHKKLEAAIAGYERVGYLTSIGMMHPELNAVAVPVRTGARERLYTLSCGGIASVFNPEILQTIGAEIAILAEDLSFV